MDLEDGIQKNVNSVLLKPRTSEVLVQLSGPVIRTGCWDVLGYIAVKVSNYIGTGRYHN